MFLQSLIYELFWLKSSEYTEYRIIISQYFILPSILFAKCFVRKLIVVRQI